VSIPGAASESERVRAVEELAADTAAACTELSESVADPAMPERGRRAAARLSGLLGDLTATAINASNAYARVDEKYDTMAAVLFGDDMTALAAVLKNRLTRVQRADLTAQLATDD
jgi:hypothetical protein